MDIGNTDQEEFKRGNYSGDYGFQSPNGRKYGGCHPGFSSSKGTNQNSSIGNRSGAGVARIIERQMLLGFNRRSCLNVLGVAGIVPGPASGVQLEDIIFKKGCRCFFSIKRSLLQQNK